MDLFNFDLFSLLIKLLGLKATLKMKVALTESEVSLSIKKVLVRYFLNSQTEIGDRKMKDWELKPVTYRFNLGSFFSLTCLEGLQSIWWDKWLSLKINC